MNSTFTIAGPHVVGDQVDGEVIVINLNNGSYFSFRDSAALLWQLLLERSVSLEEMVAHIRSRFLGEPDAIRTSVVAFVYQIESEGLIVECDASTIEAGNDLPSPANAAEAPGFEVPIFEKYSDMEEFLLVDPIHEIDVSQWPVVRKRERAEDA